MTRPRLRRIAALHGDALVAAVRLRENDCDDLDAEHLLSMFADADPSRNKSSTQWLIRRYLAGDLKLEDLGKAHDTLTTFMQHRRRLPVAERDLGRYRTFIDLWKAVWPFSLSQVQDAASGRTARRLDRERARSESLILAETSNGFTVAVPLTEFASRWWGRGTNWCTAARNRNAFFLYHIEGPLLVIILPGGQKLQLYSSPSGVQFTDELDNRVQARLVERWRPYLRPLLHWAATQNGKALIEFALECIRDRDLYMAAIQGDGRSLIFVPQEMRDHDMCMEAVKKNGAALQYVPDDLKTSEMCFAAIRQHGEALRFVPSHLVSREMQVAAIAHAGHALWTIPEDMRDREICLTAIKQTGLALRNVPQGLATRDICLMAVGQYGPALYHVPMEFRDHEMCMAAVKQSGGALHHVPNNLRDREMCLTAVRQRGSTLANVPAVLRDQEMCLEAIENCGAALAHVPEHLRDRDICQMAVERHGDALRHVPRHLIDREMAITAFSPGRSSPGTVAATTVLPPELCFALQDLLPRLDYPSRWSDTILDDLRERLASALHDIDPASDNHLPGANPCLS